MIPAPQPFDHLIYCGNSFFDRCVRVKTWSNASHIEIYREHGLTWASRNGKGVNTYNYTEDNLVAILRPKGKFNENAAIQWFIKTANGQAYDWLGLLCFTLAVKRGSPNKMFCSEFATNLDRIAGFNPFHPSWPADKVSPGMFLQSERFDWVWFDGRRIK